MKICQPSQNKTKETIVQRHKRNKEKWSCFNCGSRNWRFLTYLKNNRKYTWIVFYCTACLMQSCKRCDISFHRWKKEIEKDIKKYNDLRKGKKI